ncbi:hypothetical protein J1N35_010881, partial [Gossypium stocksii]
AEDQILEMYIHNLSMRAPRVIEQHLQEVRFLHMSFMLEGGTKLDPTLINVLVKIWKPETHTFHLPCGECTITLEDVALELGLPVDELVAMGIVVVGDWSGICEQTLSKVRQTIPSSPHDIEKLHMVNLWERINEDWVKCHEKYIW